MDEQDYVFKSVDPDDVFVKVLASPMKPSAKDVEVHNTTHLPYRNWCPICVKSRGKESPHNRHMRKEGGMPMISLDYKSFGECAESLNKEDQKGEKIRAVVMRDHDTGMIAAHLIERKGDSDEWLVKRLVLDIADWGRTDVVLKTDGEAAIVGLQRAIAEGRIHSTVPENPPAYSPQSNGVAERAVQEFSYQLRSLKLALESRIKVAIGSHWKIMHLMAEHASYLLCRFAKGSDGKTPNLEADGVEAQDKL